MRKSPAVFVRNMKKHPIEESEAFREYLSRSSVRDPDTIERSLSRFFRETAPCRLEELTYIHIEHGLQRLMGYGYETSYINKLFMQVRGFLAWCVNADYLVKNPAFKVRPPRLETDPNIVVVDNDFIKQMTDYIRSHGTAEQCVLWGALRMGARISEPCMAKLSDIRIDMTQHCAFLKCAMKTKTRWAKQPRWTLPYYVALLKAGEEDLSKPLLYLNGQPLTRINAHGKEVSNHGARTLIARRWLQETAKAVVGDTPFKPKDMRSSFISRECAEDPNQILMIAEQVGNSIQVIQNKYLKNLRAKEFPTGEDD